MADVIVMMALSVFLQGGVAWLLGRHGRFKQRFRGLLVALFLMNGVLTALMALRRLDDLQQTAATFGRAIACLDFATVLIMLRLATIWSTDRAQLFGLNDIWPALPMAGGLLFYGLGVFASSPVAAEGVEAAQHIATYSAYGALMLVAFRSLARARPAAFTAEMFLLLAFAMRGIQFAGATGFTHIPLLWTAADLLHFVKVLFHVGLLVAALMVMAGLLAMILKHKERRALVAAGLGLTVFAMLFGVASTFVTSPDGSFSFENEALQVLTLVYARPIGVAVALVPGVFMVLSIDSLAAVAAFITLRSGLGVALGATPALVSPLGLAAAVFSIAVAIGVHHYVLPLAGLMKGMGGVPSTAVSNQREVGPSAAEGQARTWVEGLVSVYDDHPEAKVKRTPFLEDLGLPSGSEGHFLGHVAMVLARLDSAPASVKDARAALKGLVDFDEPAGKDRSITFRFTETGCRRAKEWLSGQDENGRRNDNRREMATPTGADLAT